MRRAAMTFVNSITMPPRCRRERQLDCDVALYVLYYRYHDPLRSYIEQMHASRVLGPASRTLRWQTNAFTPNQTPQSLPLGFSWTRLASIQESPALVRFAL